VRADGRLGSFCENALAATLVGAAQAGGRASRSLPADLVTGKSPKQRR
jgi:hypothetical protein